MMWAGVEGPDDDGPSHPALTTFEERVEAVAADPEDDRVSVRSSALER